MANLRVNKITGTEVFETTGSVQFDGSGDYLSLPVSSDFQFESEDFTIECWIYKRAIQNDDILGVYNTSSNRRTFILQTIDDGKITFILSDTGTAGTVFSSNTGELDISTWYHIAVTRNGNDIKIFKNGSLVKSGTFSGSIYNNTNDGFRIGSTDYSAANSREFEGHISNLRILKGKALYTENFTPPTRELTVTPETVLLCCQSTTNTAQEATGKTITVNGNAVANELTPGLLTDVVKSGGSSAITGSVEFDGTGDYLALSSSDFAFGTGDFTLEFWFYDTSPTSGIRRWITSTLGAFGTPTFVIREANGSINFEGGTQTVAYPKNNSWSHIAYTRSNGVEYVFYNGVLLISDSSTRNYADTTLYIGGYYNVNNTEYTQGFISNLRIIKGQALYTQNFIPPTRELKNIPGTVLLCCQDSNDPTQEATGKTITPYGSLVYNPPELVADGGFDDPATYWSSAGADWTISGGVATINSADAGFDFLGTLTSSAINGTHYELRFDISSWTAGRLELSQSNSSNIGVTVTGNGSYTFRFRYTGTTNANIALYSYTGTTASFTLDNVSLKVVASTPKPAFTPPVGFDGSVTFEGTTKINTENYFYLPTGNTESRDTNPGVRGVFSAGYQAPATPNATNVTDYINISSTGNAQDFGDSTSPRWGVGSCSSSTRGLIGGGTNPGPGRLNIIDYITIASTGDAQDFGDLTDSRRALGSCSSPTRGIFAGGYLTAPEVPATVLYNIIEYVTISSTGNAQDFGDTTFGGGYKSGFSSPTRGVIGGNYLYGGTPSFNNVIDYITIASTGNAQDFGDLTQNKASMGACSNSVRGLFGGGFTPGTINNIDYVTIASTGNAQDFGDLLQSRLTISGTSSQIRGIFGGGAPATNVIQYVSIMSTGNSIDFGDLTVARGYFDACSNGHGGLG